MVNITDETTGTADKMWEAVQTRDSTADGRFVYAVRSTGIYCRPTCPSRRPSPHRVAFFPRAADAESAGFRACKRCLPDQDSPSARLVRRICQYIQECSERSDSAPTLSELGRATGSSPSHLQRVFKEATGVTPRQYAAAWRLDRFKAMIKDGQDISSALYEAGFGSLPALGRNCPVSPNKHPGPWPPPEAAPLGILQPCDRYSCQCLPSCKHPGSFPTAPPSSRTACWANRIPLGRVPMRCPARP